MWCSAPTEPQPLSVLVDFLVGESVATLSRKYQLPADEIEAAIRSALARYNFSAAQGSTIGRRVRAN